MRSATVEKWVWVCIYGGLLLVSLGLFTQRQAFGLGLGMILVGSVLAFVGAMLILVRSRMKE